MGMNVKVDRVLLPSAYFQNRSSIMQRLPKAQINTFDLCCEQIQNSSSALCIMSSGSTGVLTAARNTSPYPLPALASPQPLGDRGAELAMCITLAQVKATPGYCPALDSKYGFSKMLLRLSASLLQYLLWERSGAAQDARWGLAFKWHTPTVSSRQGHLAG